MSVQPATPAGADPFACLPRIEEYLSRAVSSVATPPLLGDAVAYALLSGGKRLRPVLAWNCCEAVGGRGEDALPACAAVEFVHTFSLVHDDLPAMDDDDVRRGRPTLHIHAGQAMAILAGDALLAAAFGIIAEREPDPRRATALARELAAGSAGMIAGQVYDTLGGFGSSLDDASKLSLVHVNKTGALIRAACRMGAMCGAPPAPAEAGSLPSVTAFADAIGLMFQIVDDLLDVEQTAEHAGKRTRKDADAGKLTWPGVHGVPRSRQEVSRLEELALSALQSLGKPAEPLRVLCRHLATRTR